MTSEPVLVLGMHRSGTSCLAGCLEAGGLHLGEVNTAAPFNRKGNRESLPLMQLHDSVLADHGASWDNPPADELDWTEPRLDQLKAHIAAFDAYPCWGSKDPRALFLLKGWRAASNPRFVGTFRHPLSVTRSLVTRAEAWGREMTPSHALGLWIAYNTRLVEEAGRQPFPLIRYDLHPDAYRERLAEICSGLGLDAEGAFSFFSSQLIHHDLAGEPTPEAARPLWERLLSLAK